MYFNLVCGHVCEWSFPLWAFDVSSYRKRTQFECTQTHTHTHNFWSMHVLFLLKGQSDELRIEKLSQLSWYTHAHTAHIHVDIASRPFYIQLTGITGPREIVWIVLMFVPKHMVAVQLKLCNIEHKLNCLDQAKPNEMKWKGLNKNHWLFQLVLLLLLFFLHVRNKAVRMLPHIVMLESIIIFLVHREREHHFHRNNDYYFIFHSVGICLSLNVYAYRLNHRKAYSQWMYLHTVYCIHGKTVKIERDGVSTLREWKQKVN